MPPIETSALESVSPLEEDPYEQFKTKEAERLKPPPVQAAADDKTPQSDSTTVEEPAAEPDSAQPTATEVKDKAKPGPTRKRDAESKISQQTTRIQELERERDEDRRKHAEEVARLNAQLTTQPKREEPPQDTRPAAEPAAPQGPMKRSAFREKYVEAHPEATYNDVEDAYDSYRDQYHDNQRRVAETQARLLAKEAETAAAHPDYHQIVTRDAVVRMVKTLAEPAVIALRDVCENPTDMLYHLLNNPVEAARISRLLPMVQVREIYNLSASLAKPAAAAAEPAKPPVTPSLPVTRVTPITRVTPPPRHVLTGAGASPVEGPDKQDPSYDNWKKAEQRRVGKRA